VSKFEYVLYVFGDVICIQSIFISNYYNYTRIFCFVKCIFSSYLSYDLIYCFISFTIFSR